MSRRYGPWRNARRGRGYVRDVHGDPNIDRQWSNSPIWYEPSDGELTQAAKDQREATYPGKRWGRREDYDWFGRLVKQ